MWQRGLFAFAGWVALVAAPAAMAALPSPGCGSAPPPPPESFVVDGRAREAIVVLPETYEPDRPYALVFGFHGRTSDNALARRYFGLERAARAPAIFVYPAGLVDEAGLFTWSEPGDPPHALRDFALFDSALEELAGAYCVDLDAVFVVGHSLGATFANSLACARADRIRGLASVAGGVNPSDCTGDVAALLLHNPRDAAVPVSEGERARDVLVGEEVEEAEPEPLDGFTCERHAEGGSFVLWCLHAQDLTPRGRFYPHQWPDGAADAIMRFFERLAGQRDAGG